MTAGGPGSDGGSVHSRSVALVGGLAVLTGLALPIASGWAIGLLAVAIVAGLAVGRRLPSSAAAPTDSAELAASPARRASRAALVVLPVAVALAVAGRALGGLLVAFPAAAWGVGALAIGSALVAFASGRARALAMLATGVLVIGSGVVGERFEAGGDEARGWAHSGPILGIHPFQTTAIVVDGFGPYDLPINDYVEPDGSRGYGPAEFADALQRALVAVAELHYAEGPARARRAFADARVETVTTAAVPESLADTPTPGEHPRFVVYSGTTGQRSRVAFVCPGKPDDPAGVPEEAPLERMCPNKYVSEASAGLGVTGRWAGYTEARGNERFGLSRLFGWTRSDDDEGRRVTDREVRWWAWLSLVIPLALVLTPGRSRDAIGPVADAGASTVVVAGGLLVIALVVSGLTPLVGPFEDVPSWARPWTPAGWLPLAVVGLGLAVGHDDRAEGGGGLRARLGWLWPVGVVLATLAVAHGVAAQTWAQPDLVGHGALPLERFVLGAAQAIGERGGLTIFEVEGAVAATLIAVLAAAMIAALARLGAVVAPLAPGARTGASLVAVAIAAALVVSRKTDGGAALMPMAMVTLAVLGSASRLAAGPAAGRSVRMVVHVVLVALALAVIFLVARSLPTHPFVTACTLVAVATVASALVFLGRPGPRPASPGPSDPASGPPSDPPPSDPDPT